jgi:hypothetical protein
MAKVFEMIATNEEDKHYEDSIPNSGFHVQSPIEYRTLCGIQMDGDDGVASGRTQEGRVTCPICLAIIEYCQTISLP